MLQSILAGLLKVVTYEQNIAGKSFPSKPAIQSVQGDITPANADVIVDPASNQSYHDGRLPVLITHKAASISSLVWDQAQL